MRTSAITTLAKDRHTRADNGAKEGEKMVSEITVILTSKEGYGRRMPPAAFGAFVEGLGPVTRQSVQMAFQRRSSSAGRPPRWLDRAADVRFVGHEARNGGDTVLTFEAPRLEEAAEELYLQGELWPERPQGTDTAFDLFADVLEAVSSNDRDSRWLDTPLLRSIARFGRYFDTAFTSALFRPPRFAKQPVELNAEVATTAKSMRESAPPPRRIRIAGWLDMVRLSTQTFGVKLDDGTSIDGVLATGDVRALASLLSQEVVVQGRVVYRPSGRPLRIDAESVRQATGEAALWRALPESGPRLPQELRRPQTPKTGIGAIIGNWPGDESDEEVGEALERVS